MEVSGVESEQSEDISPGRGIGAGVCVRSALAGHEASCYARH